MTDAKLQTGRIEYGPLFEDISSVIGVDDQRNKWVHISAIVHTLKEDIPVLKILHDQTKADYANETSGYGNINFLLLLGDYVYRLYPQRDNLEITIKTRYLYGDGVEDVERRKSIRSKLLLDHKANPPVFGGTDANRDIETLNQGGVAEIKGELQELFEEVYRIVPVSGTYPDTSAQELLEGTIPHRLNLLKGANRDTVEARHIVEPDNKAKYRQLVIPEGVMAKDLPGWLQEHGKGVYSFGIGNFIEQYKTKRTWFVYPLYDTSRFDKDVERMVIYFAPQERFMGIDNTYRTEGKVTYIVTTTTPPMSDNAGNADLNRGIGFRYTDQQALMTKPAVLDEGKTVASYRNVNTEVIHKGRKDQLNYARTVGSMTNQFMHVSRINRNQLALIDINWEYSDPGLVYPAMPCKCVFMHQGRYTEKRGVLLSKYTVRRVVGNPVTTDRYKVDTQLRIMMEPLNYETVPDTTQYSPEDSFLR